MLICRDVRDPRLQTPTTATLGVFDGLHLGHQVIMRTVIEHARASGSVATVVTFDPHPRAVLHPATAPPLLQTPAQRLEGMRFLGIDQVVVLEFDMQLAALDADTFVRDYLCNALDVRAVYLGRGFAFGRQRTGNIEALRRLSKELDFFADEVDEVTVRGHRVSSTRIRNLLLSGRVNAARAMLGRPYGVEGLVIEGRHIGGSMLSFATANITPANRVLPAAGVYITATLVAGQWRRGVTNIGTRPTVSAEPIETVETHLLDFEGDLYGQTIRVRFLRRLRDEQRFDSLDKLRDQITRDVHRARLYFEHAAVKRQLSVV